MAEMPPRVPGFFVYTLALDNALLNAFVDSFINGGFQALERPAVELKTSHFVLFVGEEELEKGIYTLKDTVTEEEKKLTIDDIESLVKSRRR